MGALSFSPSPMTTTPRIETVLMSWRIALTAAPPAPFLSPRPTQRAAAMAAASVTRTSSIARLRSGAAGSVVSGEETVVSSDMTGRPLRSVVPWILRGPDGGLQIGPDQPGHGFHRHCVRTGFDGRAGKGSFPHERGRNLRRHEQRHRRLVRRGDTGRGRAARGGP